MSLLDQQINKFIATQKTPGVTQLEIYQKRQAFLMGVKSVLDMIEQLSQRGEAREITGFFINLEVEANVKARKVEYFIQQNKAANKTFSRHNVTPIKGVKK